MAQRIEQLRITAFTAVAVLLAGAGYFSTAVAQTPDGETPANEGVCDVLQGGSTPGLYGLCVAYCEAQDLDTFDKSPPSEKILANYRKKMQAGDLDMPCIQVPCPCWSASELGSITADNQSAACPSATNKIQIIDNAPRTKFAEADTNAGQERCRYIDLNAVPPTVRSFKITTAEAQSCFAQVADACDQTGH
jgi:hypothetical protein